MRKLALAAALAAGLVLALTIALSSLAAQLRGPTFDPVKDAQDQIAILQAQTLAPVDLTLAIGWRVLLFVAALAAIGYVAALGYAHVGRYRRERTPNAAGLLPILVADQETARMALGAFHQAQIAAAQRPMVPQTLTYSPNHALSYAPHHSVDYDAPAGLLPDVMPLALPGLTDMAALGYTPTSNAILLGLGEGSELITVPAAGLCHVALVGATGGGKSNLLRLLLPQLQAIGARVCLADPHYAPVDPESGEDWRGIAARLHMAPAVQPSEIAALFGYLTDELARRLEMRRNGQRWGAPLFLALDELPVIADEVPDSVNQLGKLLREGRKVGIFSVGASQSMLVKVVGGDSAARECYRTAFYVGGDLRSASALLDMPQREIDDGALGTGVALLRSKVTSPARLVRVPYASNQAIAGLLGDGASDRWDVGAPSGMATTTGQHSGPDGHDHPSIIHPSPHGDTSSGCASADTPEAARAIALFRGGMDVGKIVTALTGMSSKSGKPYLTKLAEVQQAIRTAFA
jgi:hypothetical protein